MSPHVLIAEPNTQKADLFVRALQNCGFHVDVVTSAIACFQWLQESSADVIILSTDLVWGGSDGVLAQMRQGDLPRVPVVLLTAGTERPEPPVCHVLVSPFRLDDLIRVTQWAACHSDPNSKQLATPVHPTPVRRPING